jgi:hypothetical protein
VPESFKTHPLFFGNYSGLDFSLKSKAGNRMFLSSGSFLLLALIAAITIAACSCLGRLHLAMPVFAAVAVRTATAFCLAAFHRARITLAATSRFRACIFSGSKARSDPEYPKSKSQCSCYSK